MLQSRISWSVAWRRCGAGSTEAEDASVMLSPRPQPTEAGNTPVDQRATDAGANTAHAEATRGWPAEAAIRCRGDAAKPQPTEASWRAGPSPAEALPRSTERARPAKERGRAGAAVAREEPVHRGKKTSAHRGARDTSAHRGGLGPLARDGALAQARREPRPAGARTDWSIGANATSAHRGMESSVQ